MSPQVDTRERVKALEVKVEHLTQSIDQMSEKVQQMHDLLIQARSARWAIIGAATLGGFMASKLFTILPFFPTK